MKAILIFFKLNFNRSLFWIYHQYYSLCRQTSIDFDNLNSLLMMSNAFFSALSALIFIVERFTPRKFDICTVLYLHSVKFHRIYQFYKYTLTMKYSFWWRIDLKIDKKTFSWKNMGFRVLSHLKGIKRSNMKTCVTRPNIQSQCAKFLVTDGFKLNRIFG